MAKLKKIAGYIVIAVLVVVAIVGLFLPMWGYPEVNVTFSASYTLRYAAQVAGFGSLFSTPTLYLTLVCIALILDVILVIAGVLSGKRLFGHIAAVVSLVGAVIAYVASNTYTPSLVGFWLMFLPLLAAFFGWFIANNWKKFLAGCKEFCRKFMVMIKRKPQLIPLCAFIVTFVFYSLNLTHVSNTTAKVLGSGMGLAGFVTMLLSMLGILCCMNAFPYRKKTNIPMLVLCFVMAAIIFGADIFYFNSVRDFINSAKDAAAVIKDTPSIAIVYNRIQTHMILLGVSVVLTALLPVYSKLLRMVKTSVEVEGNEQMGAIDITAE